MKTAPKIDVSRLDDATVDLTFERMINPHLYADEVIPFNDELIVEEPTAAEIVPPVRPAPRPQLGGKFLKMAGIGLVVAIIAGLVALMASSPSQTTHKVGTPATVKHPVGQTVRSFLKGQTALRVVAKPAKAAVRKAASTTTIASHSAVVTSVTSTETIVPQTGTAPAAPKQTIVPRHDVVAAPAPALKATPKPKATIGHDPATATKPVTAPAANTGTAPASGVQTGPATAPVNAPAPAPAAGTQAQPVTDAPVVTDVPVETPIVVAPVAPVVVAPAPVAVPAPVIAPAAPVNNDPVIAANPGAGTQSPNAVTDQGSNNGTGGSTTNANGTGSVNPNPSTIINF